MVSFIKPSAAANMKQYLMPSYGEIMKHALTCKAIGAEVCSSVWCEFVLVKINMNQLGVILYLNMYVCKFKPIQHVFRQKAFCKESILFHSYTLFYSLQRGQGIFIAINYTHVFSGDPGLLSVLDWDCLGYCFSEMVNVAIFFKDYLGPAIQNKLHPFAGDLFLNPDIKKVKETVAEMSLTAPILRHFHQILLKKSQKLLDSN